jgi:hypothetical protein
MFLPLCFLDVMELVDVVARRFSKRIWRVTYVGSMLLEASVCLRICSSNSASYRYSVARQFMVVSALTALRHFDV